jgi:hypothetical protein
MPGRHLDCISATQMVPFGLDLLLDGIERLRPEWIDPASTVGPTGIEPMTSTV